RQLAADGQTETRPAILAGRGAIRLLEGLEDDLLFLRLDADAGVDDAERDHAGGAVERVIVGRPPVARRVDLERYAARVRELERVGEQVLEDLLQAFRVRLQAARQMI